MECAGTGNTVGWNWDYYIQFWDLEYNVLVLGILFTRKMLGLVNQCMYGNMEYNVLAQGIYCAEAGNSISWNWEYNVLVPTG